MKGEQILNIEKFFEFLENLERMQLISKSDIFSTFSDLFESTSEDTLELLFNMMETKVFNGDLIQASNGENKQDQVLNMIARICKTIMRKLSATHDTGFRGKVQKLIASVFPLTHPSGLNRIGKLNIKNQTIYQSLEEVKEEIESSQ